MDASTTNHHADSGWDGYPARVLRNEGRLAGLEALVAETRSSDRALIEQRSDSLAQELERRAEALLELVTARADAVLALSKEERDSDRREVEVIYTEAEKRAVVSFESLREIQTTSMQKNYEQSREAISALEQRQKASTERLEQMVRQWRESDKEARDLFAAELGKHLDTLNHNNERMASLQAIMITREVWQIAQDAALAREAVLRGQIIVLEKTTLGMQTAERADKAYAAIGERLEESIVSASKVLDNKIGVVEDKVAELKSYRDTTQGRSSGYQAIYGWGVAAIGLIISAIILANALLR